MTEPPQDGSSQDGPSQGGSSPDGSVPDGPPRDVTEGGAGDGDAGSGPPRRPAPGAGEAREPERVLAGRYVLEEQLGHGGMAVVRAAQDRVLGRRVAVKLLRADLARDEAFQERFRREARSAAALNHPSVVRVHDVGEGAVPPGDEVVPFIVMELVQGVTVRALLDERGRDARGGRAAGATDPGTSRSEGTSRSPDTSRSEDTSTVSGPPGSAPGTEDEPGDEPGVDVDLAVTITAGVLEALAFSHRAGIVHRDIKPGNVMLTPEGRVTVMDFGIARAAADTSVTTTHTAAVLGTALYLSPEQARGRPVDARTDLYSTGCLLHELLTGRPPFQGESALSLAYQHVSETPDPPSLRRPGLPSALDRVTARALAKDPEDRYPDADAFRLDLLAAADGTATPAEVAAAAAATPAGATTATEVVDEPAPASSPFAAEDAETPPTDRGRRAVVVLVALVALALVAAAALVLPRLLSDDDPVALVAVPDVVGLSAEVAQASVERADLAYAATQEPSDDVAAGLVLAQDPGAAEQAPSGSTVDVVVSAGPETVAVPDVVGSTEQRARQALDDAGLEVGDVDTEPDPTTSEGSVVSVDPSAGSSVPSGSEVDLVLSDGTVEIDDYTGLPLATARAALSALSLQGSLEYAVSDAAENTVVDQEPGAGTVPQGSTVTLVVAQPAAPTPTVTETVTPTPTPTATATPTGTPTGAPTGGPAGTPTAIPTATSTGTPAPTGTPTAPAAPTATPTGDG